MTRDNPQTTPNEDDSRRRCQRAKEFGHPAISKDRLTRVACRVRGAMGKEKGRLKPLSSLAIVLSVLGLNLMGDGLRDLMDPKLARQR